MGDVITYTAVLRKNIDPTQPDYLFFSTNGEDYRNIMCKPKDRFIEDENKNGRNDPWEYEEKEDVLHLSPSLLCLDTHFHTDYNWQIKYVICPAEEDQFTYYLTINK